MHSVYHTLSCTPSGGCKRFIVCPPNLKLHSHTLENKSSLAPPKLPPPPAGLFCTGGGLLVAGVVGAALLQPPKSSSGATFGTGCEVLPKPLSNVDDRVSGLAGVPPQAEKSVDIGIDGFRAAEAAFGFGAVVVAEGSGVAHASLEPQASLLFEKLENVLVGAGCACVAVFDVACEGAAGAERLKAELMFADGAGVGAGA